MYETISLSDDFMGHMQTVHSLSRTPIMQEFSLASAIGHSTKIVPDV